VGIFRLVFTEDLPDQSQIVELGEERYEIRAWFNSRTLQWYLDISTEDGVSIATGEALGHHGSPGRSRLDFLPLLYTAVGVDEANVRSITNGDLQVAYLEA
jgi:hypothetical protein